VRTIPSLFFAALACGALSACDRAPIVWQDAIRLDSASLAAAGSGWRLVIDAKGIARAESPLAPVHQSSAAICPGSGVAAHVSGGEWFTAWWVARPDSSVKLMVSRSTDAGATWAAPMPADARDAGRRGCARPAPAIAADSATGFVHLAYFLEPAEGAGVWLVHSMEHGTMWHAPVALAFGADPALASVAVLGDTVAVAFESPNRSEASVSLSLSTSDGHLIDHTLPWISGRSVPVGDPRVALRGKWIGVAWVTERGGLVFARTGVRQ
jgi:hypothetical protein